MRTMTRRIHQAVCKYGIISNNAVYQKLLPPEKENVEKIEMASTADNPIGYLDSICTRQQHHKHPLKKTKEKCRLIEKERSHFLYTKYKLHTNLQVLLYQRNFMLQ